MSKPKRRLSTYEKNIKRALNKLNKDVTLSDASREIITTAIKYFINYNDEVPLTDLFNDEDKQRDNRVD